MWGINKGMANKVHKIDDFSKYCGICDEVKPLTDFYKDSRNKCGRQSRCKVCVTSYYKENKDKRVKYANARYHDNNEEILAKRAELRKRPEAKKIKSELDKRYREENKNKISLRYQKWATENRKRLNEYNREWCRNNIERARLIGRASENAYRARKMNANGNLTTQECADILSGQPFCSYCGNNDNLELDHINPLSKGGSNLADNIMVLCRSCNSSKGAKTLLEWLTYKSLTEYLTTK